jgi:hypothetical protein
MAMVYWTAQEIKCGLAMIIVIPTSTIKTVCMMGETVVQHQPVSKKSVNKNPFFNFVHMQLQD